MILNVVRHVFSIKAMDTEFKAACVDLKLAIVWAVHEQRLHLDPPKEVEFNIKLNGRPLGGLFY